LDILRIECLERLIAVAHTCSLRLKRPGRIVDSLSI
jgi:hypothetical protein